MWTIAGIISMLVGVALIWSVLVKKFPQLKLIDLSTLAKERHAQVKSRIIKERFDRSLKSLERKSGDMFGGFKSGMKGLYDRLHGRLKEIEVTVETPVDETPDIEMIPATPSLPILVARATEQAALGQLEEAESMYIEALKENPRDFEAYRGLASLYVLQQLYQQAKETLEYAVNLHAEEPVGHGTRTDLGALYMETGEPAKAHEQFRLALEAQPYNPRYLDYFLEASILIGDLDSAEEAFEVLETAEPDHAKLADFRSRIDTLRIEPVPEAA